MAELTTFHEAQAIMTRKRSTRAAAVRANMRLKQLRTTRMIHRSSFQSSKKDREQTSGSNGDYQTDLQTEIQDLKDKNQQLRALVCTLRGSSILKMSRLPTNRSGELMWPQWRGYDTKIPSHTVMVIVPTEVTSSGAALVRQHHQPIKKLTATEVPSPSSRHPVAVVERIKKAMATKRAKAEKKKARSVKSREIWQRNKTLAVESRAEV